MHSIKCHGNPLKEGAGAPRCRGLALAPRNSQQFGSGSKALGFLDTESQPHILSDFMLSKLLTSSPLPMPWGWGGGRGAGPEQQGLACLALICFLKLGALFCQLRSSFPFTSAYPWAAPLLCAPLPASKPAPHKAILQVPSPSGMRRRRLEAAGPNTGPCILTGGDRTVSSPAGLRWEGGKRKGGRCLGSGLCERDTACSTLSPAFSQGSGGGAGG